MAMSPLRPILAVALLLAPMAAGAEPMTHRTVFTVYFGALPVGEATFDIHADDTGYRLKGSGRTVGIVELFAPGTGSVMSEGRIVGDHVIAVKNAIHFSEREKKKNFEMEFSDGNVSRVAYQPDDRKKKDGPQWVPVTEDQLRAVVDPASGLVVPVAPERANDPHAVCDRTLNVYDGDTRYDIALAYKATKTVTTEGYKGFTYVCQLRYIPIAGHRRNQRNIEYMSSNKDMEVWLAPIARSNIYTPIRIEVPTWIGHVTAVPDHFGPPAH